jgi:hypothetical protein
MCYLSVHSVAIINYLYERNLVLALAVRPVRYCPPTIAAETPSGFLNRTSDGFPGPATLWQGMQLLATS